MPLVLVRMHADMPATNFASHFFKFTVRFEFNISEDEMTFHGNLVVLYWHRRIHYDFVR